MSAPPAVQDEYAYDMQGGRMKSCCCDGRWRYEGERESCVVGFLDSPGHASSGQVVKHSGPAESAAATVQLGAVGAESARGLRRWDQEE